LTPLAAETVGTAIGHYGIRVSPRTVRPRPRRRYQARPGQIRSR
jgi:hypothetical protein